MADDIATITFANDTLSDGSGNTATLTGTIQVDYTTRSYQGNYRITGAGLASGGTLSNAGGLTSSNGQFTLSDGALTVSYAGEYPSSATSETYAIAGMQYAGANQPLSTVACYVEGTGIRTPGGDRAVETLAVGDMVVTASGEHRTIRWIGRRGYSGRFANRNLDVLPICFAAGSLGENIPYRDLRVSPKHAMLIDGVLVPAECLVNGTSITKAIRVDEVSYYHVELDSHDVLLAEGAPSESFIDDDSVGSFVNASDRTPPQTSAYAPRVEQGLLLNAIQRRLSRLATAA